MGDFCISLFGSVDFFHEKSEELCLKLGARLATLSPPVKLYTGANASVHEKISEGYAEYVGLEESREYITHLAPLHFKCKFKTGTIKQAGADSAERRKILAECGNIGISVEGGPGTVDEMKLLVAAGKQLVPIGRTGGASSGMFDAPIIPCPENIRLISYI